MFNIEDTELIKKIIDEREDGMIIPVYLRVGNEFYSILEIGEIINCHPSIFKVGFGTSDSVFVRNKFPKNKLINFNNARVFTVFDEDKQCNVDYFTFESSDVVDDNSYLHREINTWYGILLRHIMAFAEEKRRLRIKYTMEELS